jgi:2'-5' RNA ligase
MENAATLYAVVLTFPEEFVRDISDLRDKYQRYVSYTIVPHITLKMPFKPAADIAVINDMLIAVAEKTAPFTLVMGGIRFFEGANNVAYLAVKTGQPVTELHKDIVNSLRGYVKEEGRQIYELDRFTPHMTIAECIPDDAFPEIKKQLSGYDLHLQCEVSAFSLYSGRMDSEWQPKHVFELSKK